jgi:uncharacterized membrane protein
MIVRAELKNMAKEQIRGNLGTLLVCFLIYSVIVTGCQFIPVPLAGAVIAFIIAPAFILGFTMIFLRLVQGIKPQVGDIFKGFDQFGRALSLYARMMIFIFLWTLLLIIPGIIKSFSYSMAMYVLAEHPELTAREALDESSRMMRGHKWELLVLYLSFFWWYLLGTVTLGIACIYIAPYITATITNYYHAVKAS